jgi:major vault protein
MNSALRLRAKRDFVDTVDGKPVQRVAGDLFQFKGPGTYIPRVEVEVLAEEKARVIKHGQALKLRATNKTVDYKGVPRNAGEEWLIREDGAYLPVKCCNECSYM